MAAAHGFKPERGHTEPRRGAEWWGKSPLVTLGLFQSDPPSGRNPKQPLPQKWICTRSNPTSWSALRPPSGASPLPHWICMCPRSWLKASIYRTLQIIPLADLAAT
ncbi:hypothetical protein EUX57_15540 [Pseudomonas orientalis]|uniref:Uncharacterized protein n=1 Tax=Pseudomonas orientalis TaxID=76758 RepID=A0A4Q7CZE4_9PSED|nr:hypothetical protein EUX57_15540 [Pseudomonas orientalis]